MQLCVFVGFHSGTNKLTSLLSYETTWQDIWLQTFRQILCVSFSKGETWKTILTLSYITTVVLRNVRETITQWRDFLNTHYLYQGRDGLTMWHARQIRSKPTRLQPKFLRPRHQLEEIWVELTVVFIWIIKLRDVRIWNLGIESNREGNDRTLWTG
jgi:hypothetical protein